MATGGAKLPNAGAPPKLGAPGAPALALLACLAVLALAASPASAAENPYEPNETAAAAAGPLALGQSYFAALESAGDRDYYSFYVASPAATQISITVQNLGGGGPTADIAATIFDSSSTPVASQTFIREGESRVVTATLEPQKYYLELNASTGFGDSYSFATAGGEGAFGSYATIASRCGRASAATEKGESKLNRLESKLQRATARLRRSRYAGRRALRAAQLARRGARRRVVRARRSLRAARKSEQPWCSIPQ